MILSGHTQKTLATAIGKSKNIVNAYVNNRSSCDSDTANRICEALGISDVEERAEIFLNIPSQIQDN